MIKMGTFVMCASLVSTLILVGKNLIQLARLEKAHDIFSDTLSLLENDHYKEFIPADDRLSLNGATATAAAQYANYSYDALSPEQKELYDEYVPWVYNSTQPKLANRYADADFSCEKVYCGYMGDEGMSNTLFSFLGLLMVAYRDDACVCDPTILIDHPRHTDISARRRKLSEFLDVTRDADNKWRKLGLPPVVSVPDGQISYQIVSTHESELFELVHYTNKYLHKARKLKMKLPTHPVIANYFRMIFRYPSDLILRYINSFPHQYTAIHARVEHDFRTHHSGAWKSNGKNVKQILEITEKGLRELVSHELEEDAINNVVVAVSIDNVQSKEADDPEDIKIGEEMYNDLQEKTTFWGASMQLIEKPTQFSYFERSLIDMIVCQRATYFVGHFWSTFSETVALVRQEKASTFHYGSGKLIPFEKSDNILIAS